MTTTDAGVVIVSGGMDSAVTASIAAGEAGDLHFLHVNYGQRTERKELACFHALCDHFRAKGRLVADLRQLAAIGGSSLTDPDIPVEAADLDRKTFPSSYVPFRNAHLLAAAVSWAEVLGASSIYIGAIAVDGSGYPDCRPEFYEAFQRVVDTGTGIGPALRIRTPVIGMTKAEVVRTGLRLGTPFHLTWSCYQAEDAACGECDSCALRLRGFREAGAEDPIAYKKRM